LSMKVSLEALQAEVVRPRGVPKVPSRKLAPGEPPRGGFVPMYMSAARYWQ
jgi:hypothetical protein